MQYLADIRSNECGGGMHMMSTYLRKSVHDDVLSFLGMKENR